jgi:hypothetical protein
VKFISALTLGQGSRQADCVVYISAHAWTGEQTCRFHYTVETVCKEVCRIGEQAYYLEEPGIAFREPCCTMDTFTDYRFVIICWYRLCGLVALPDCLRSPGSGTGPLSLVRFLEELLG